MGKRAVVLILYMEREREGQGLARVPQDLPMNTLPLRHSEQGSSHAPFLFAQSNNPEAGITGHVKRVLEGIYYSAVQAPECWQNPAQFCLISFNEIFLGILMCFGISFASISWNKQNLHNENSMDTSIKQILKTSLLSGTAHSLPLKWSRHLALPSFQGNPSPTHTFIFQHCIWRRQLKHRLIAGGSENFHTLRSQ